MIRLRVDALALLRKHFPALEFRDARGHKSSSGLSARSPELAATLPVATPPFGLVARNGVVCVGSAVVAYVSHWVHYETITCLEMTSPSELVPGRPQPARLKMQKGGSAAAPVVRATYVRIGAPHGWTGRSDWSDAQWEEELSRPGIHAWIARVDEDVAGFVELEAESSGDVGIVDELRNKAEYDGADLAVRS